MTTVKLYHGTSEARWRKIRESGMVMPGSPSPHKGDEQGLPNLVYFGTLYSLQFALRAAHDDGSDPCILECGVPEDGLVPDEDWIAYHAGREQARAWLIQNTRKRLDPEVNALALTGLHKCGSVAYVGPLLLAQVRYASVIRFDKVPDGEDVLIASLGAVSAHPYAHLLHKQSNREFEALIEARPFTRFSLFPGLRSQPQAIDPTRYVERTAVFPLP